MRGMSTQRTPTEIANESVNQARSRHQSWHNTTGLTNCPWGCGDGSGLTTTKDQAQATVNDFYRLTADQQRAAKDYLVGLLSIRDTETLQRAIDYAKGEREAF